MNFNLNYNPEVSKKKISHESGVLLTGSCFAENIGTYISKRKFKCLVNPSGIVFNPVSLSNNLRTILQNKRCDENGIVKNGNTFFHLSYHGNFNSPSKETLMEKINAVTDASHNFLKEAQWLVITFGSAFVYRYLLTNEIAANCHKLPQSQFRKELLELETIAADYSSLLEELRAFNPRLNVVFTVSPVKYLRDGLVENNLSKAILIQSVHKIISTHSNSLYFPAYELVTDDLRDYRFFKEDMAHPNDLAIKYVWEKFSGAFFDKATLQLNEQLGDILRATQHRPIIENSEEHSKFKTTYFRKCELLEQKYSFLKMDKEKAFFV